MNRSELIRRVAGRTGLRAAVVGAVIRDLLAMMAKTLTEGGTVRISGFGTFSAKDRPPRTARAPRTGELVAVPAKRSIVFRASRKLRKEINRLAA